MAMIPSHLPADVVQLCEEFSNAKFEEWAKKMHPPLPLGQIVIFGRFDRYFDPQTQAAWEGFSQAGLVLAANIVNRQTTRRRNWAAGHAPWPRSSK